MRFLIFLLLVIGCGSESEEDIPDGGIVEECHELDYDKVGQATGCHDGGTPKTTTEKRGS